MQKLLLSTLLPGLLIISGCATQPQRAGDTEKTPAHIFTQGKTTTPAADPLEQLLIERRLLTDSPRPDQQATQNKLTRLYQQHRQWQGTPHQLGGVNKQGIDCSGFTQRTFAELFNIRLPRSTVQQARSGKPIEQHALQPGDLVFFRINRRLQHVGIYLENKRFLHVSSSKGVIISKLSDRYWHTRYWKAVRPKAFISGS